MSHPHLQAALARERQDMLLAEAQAARRARRARLARRRGGMSASSRSLLRWPPDWLPAGWRRLLTRRPASASAATGARAALHNGTATAGGTSASERAVIARGGSTLGIACAGGPRCPAGPDGG